MAIFSVTLADGRTASETRTCTVPLTVKIADESEKQSFTVFPLAKYDVILGKPWLGEGQSRDKLSNERG